MTGSRHLSKVVPSRKFNPIPWVVVLGLLIAAVMTYSLLTGSRMAVRYAPLADAVTEIKLEAALAHLWFEEILSGDPHKQIDTAWAHIEQCAWYANAMLEGGENHHGIFVPLQDPELRLAIEGLQEKIAAFEQIGRSRWVNQQGSGIGSEIDQRFDEVFGTLLAQADEVEKALRAAISGDLQRFVTAQALLILVCLAMTALIAFIFHRYERRRLQDLEATARFSRVLESSLNEIYVVDSKTFRFLEVNRGARENLGYSLEELTELTPLDILPEMTSAQLTDLISPLISGEREAIRTRTVHRRKDGSDYPVEVLIQKMDVGSEVLVAIILDTTQRVEAEESRKQAEDQLRQAQKMEAVGLLAGGVAHDFNNLLQGIIGYAEMARAGLPEDDSRLRDLNEVVTGAERAAALTRQLLAFSRRQVLDLRNLDLNDLTENLLKMIRRLIGEHITLEFISGHDLGAIKADPGQLEQVLMNLCVNARDAMPEGGALTIETENVRIDAAYVRGHPWATPGRFVLLSVSDTGCGMDPQTQTRIFDPFFTTKEVDRGTGLGLSTVYGIVKQHQGMIHVYSEKGKGTRFKIYFPLVERLAAQVEGVVAGMPPGGTETILVAEDDPTVRALAARVLEEAGYTVHVAQDGQEAVRVFEQHLPEISLALLDVVMPGLSGKQVYERIEKIAPDVAVLFSSGYSANAIHTGFVLDEGTDLLQKPFAPEELLRRVRAALDRS